MKVVFAGTPPFARSALEAILAAGFDVPLVLTQPERPAGRGLRPQASAVKQSALEHAIPLAQPRSLRLDGKYPEDAGQARAALEAARPDVLVVAAYGLLLPRWLLELPAHGCLNIHASLLPRWRGAAPIQRAIEAGDAHSGITIMHMDEGLDTGDIALAQPIALEPDETSASLHDKLAALGARLIVEALRQGSQGCLPRQPQDAQQACYAEKIRKDETRVNWGEDARDIARRLRAFTPTPGMAVLHQGQPIKICQARPQDFLWNGMEEALPPEVRAGTVLASDADGLLVACGRGALRITHLQRPGGKRLPVGDFLRGHPLPVGAVLGQDAAATDARPWHMARIEWLSPEEGGRQGGPIPQGSARYRPLAVFPHQRIGQMDARWDVHIVCLHHPAPLRSSVLVKYLADEAPHENFARHDHFAIHEGPRCVGTVWLEKA